LKDIVAGHEMVNAWELEEERRRLPALTIEEAARQYFELWEMARRVSPEAEELFLEERMATMRRYIASWKRPPW